MRNIYNKYKQIYIKSTTKYTTCCGPCNLTSFLGNLRRQIQTIYNKYTTMCQTIYKNIQQIFKQYPNNTQNIHKRIQEIHKT